MITVELMGGLANRMRAIAAAIWLKQQLGTTLTIIWNENYELNCPFALLFEPNENFRVIAKPRAYRYLKQTDNKQLVSTLTNKLIGFDRCIIEQGDPEKAIGEILSLIPSAKKQNIYIKTCHDFGDSLPCYKMLVPAAAIRQQIAAITTRFDAHTIGIHIRRTDHDKAIAHSPLALFIVAMKAKLATQKATNFFVCSDDKESENELVSIFGTDKIIVAPKDNSRITIPGMQAAMTDLYCLAATSQIIGSYWSSFSEVAARLNNVPHSVIKA